MSKLDNFHFSINVEVVNGGFILNYPKQVITANRETSFNYVREIFTSQQKLSKKIKEVLDEITNEADTAQK